MTIECDSENDSADGTRRSAIKRIDCTDVVHTPKDGTSKPLKRMVTLSEAEEISACADEKKEDGNSSFKNGLWTSAIEKYTDAIQMCGNVEFPSDVSFKFKNLDLYYNNRALVHIKLENYGLAINDASMAISLNPANTKSYYRRGTAYYCLANYKFAFRDFQFIARVSDASVRARLNDCDKRIKLLKFASAIAAVPVKPLSETIDLSVLPPEKEGDLIYHSDKLEPNFLTNLIELLKNPESRLSKPSAYRIVLDIINLLKDVPTLVRIELAKDDEITICGDIHGQFYDLINIFDINGLPSKTNPYLFNGDFVDRGSFSVECILTLFAAKLLFPKYVHLVRGNHEAKNVNKIYGFEGEVLYKYDRSLYDLFCESFCLLPLAHVINSKVFVVHGGLFGEDGMTLKGIEDMNRNTEPPDQGFMTDMLWSDPQTQNGRSASKRGVACCFGPDVTHKFLNDNGLDYIIRSHEAKDKGYDVEHDGKLITVFSAPNYCDYMKNQGAFIKLTGKSLKPVFTTFSEVPHPPVPAMKYASQYLQP